MDKSSIRKIMISARKALSVSDKALFDLIIKNRVLKALGNYQIVGIYVSFDDEIDTKEIIKNLLDNNKIVCIPKVKNDLLEFHMIKSLDELTIGKFNILEPQNDFIIDADKIEVMIIPLLAYDLNLYRIGYGKGFYDRYMDSQTFLKIGLAYDFQLVENTYSEIHDIKLDCIITNEKIYGAYDKIEES